METKLTPNERDILLHRLQSGCIEDCFSDTEELNCSFDEAKAAVAIVLEQVEKENRICPDHMTELEKHVLADCLDGSTWFNGGERDEIANGKLTHQKVSAWHRAADNLEKLISSICARPVYCTRH